MKKLLCVLALMFTACGGAGASTTSETTATTASGATQIPRADFVAMMVEILPAAICENEEHPLRTCVNATAAECSASMTALAQNCGQSVGPQIPEMVPDTEEAGEQYGSMLGECVGLQYVEQARAAGKFRTDDANCQPAE